MADLTIHNLEELKAFRDRVNSGESFSGKTVVLAADIDLKNEEWTPIGNSTNQFQGNFDGQGHTVSNLKIDGTGKSNQGFFGFTTNGSVSNLTIENATVTGRLNVGVVAGTPYTSKYTNIKVTGHVEVEGMAYVGGVGGKNAYADWTDITVDVDETSFVKADSVEWSDEKNDYVAYRSYVGGVIGFIGEGGHTLKNITSNINVEGSTCDVGGIAGIAHYQNNFENVSCAAKEIVVNNDHAEVGSIAGVWMNSSVGDVTMINCTVSENTKVYKTVTDGENAVKTEVDALNGNAYYPSQTGDASGKLLMATEKVNSDGSVSVNITKVDAAGTTYDASAEASKILNVDASQISSTDGVYTSAVTYKAKIGSVYYESFEAALDAAKNGDEITLLSNIGDAEYTIDKNITIRGNVTLNNVDIKVNASLALYGLKFTGTSDILTAGTATALTLENCTADVDPGKYSGRGAFITIGQSESSNPALKLVLKNNVINSAQSSNDLYSAAVFGWAYLGHVEMTGNTFGSEDNPYTFIAVKTMNAVDGAVFNIADNTIYGTDQHFTFAAFDLYQNNSRENNYTTVFNNNSVVNTNTASSANGFYFSVVEVNVYGGVGGNASVQVMDNNTVNGEKVTAADVSIDDKKAIDYVGTDVKLDSYGNIVGGNFTVEDSAAFREDLAAGMAPQVNDDGSVTPVAFDATKFYVSDTYSGNPGDKVGEGLYFDYNAFASLKDAADKATDGVNIEITGEGASAAGFISGGTIYMTGDADLDWDKGWVFIGRGTNAKDTTLVIKDADLSSTSRKNPASTGFHVSNAEKDSSSKKDGVLNIENSVVETDYLINKNEVNITGSTLRVIGGFGVAGRIAAEREDGVDHTAVMNVTDSYVEIVNENGMGIGNYTSDEGRGELNLTGSTYKANILNVREKGEVNITDSALEAQTVDNSGSIQVFGDSKLTIGSLTGSDIELLSGATLTGSTVGGDLYVRGTVSFKGDNVFNQIYDFGTYDGNSHWTVEEGASVWLTGTIAGTNRYGLGYGDKVTINGLLADADAARVQLANGEEVFCSFRSDKGLIGSNNSGFNDLNSFVVNDAYVDFAKGDQSFGTKGSRGSSGSYGNYEFIFNNAVVDANRFTFYDTDAKTVLNATDSNILLGSQLMTKDADSVFTFTNSTVTVKNPNNGNNEDNVNGGTLNLINSKLIYANAGNETQYINNGALNVKSGALMDVSNLELVNSGTITVDADSLFKANTMTNNGSIIIDASGFTGGVKKVIDLNGTAALSGVTFTNVADGVNTVLGTDGDVTLVKADQSTVYVNSAYTSQEAVDNALGGAANGMYFSGNAFNSIAEAVKNTSDKNPLNITFTGSETVASTGIAYISNEKSTFDIDGRTTTISGINNTAESLWVDLNEDMDSTAAETLLTIENAKLNATKLKADNNAVLNINNSELDFEDGFNNNIYSKNSGEIHVANSVLNNLIQVSAFGKLIEIKNSEVNSGTATNVNGGTMSVSGSQYKFRTIGVRGGGVLNVTDSVLQSKDMLTSNETQNKSAISEVSNENQIIIAVENGGTLNLKDSEVALNKVQYWDKENGKYVDTHTEKITIAENGVVNMEDSSLTVDKVINSGDFNVSGVSQLNIGTLTGTVDISGATIKDSNVGGKAVVIDDEVVFKGDNVIGSIDHSNATVTVGAGDSLKLATGRGIIKNDTKFNITGEISDALTADKAGLKASYDVDGISITGPGELNVNNAYVKLSSSQIISNKDYLSGVAALNFTNSVVDIKTLQILEAANGKVNTTFDGSVGSFSQYIKNTDADSVFTAKNGSVINSASSFMNDGEFNVLSGSTVNVAYYTNSSHGRQTGTLTVDGENSKFILKAASNDQFNNTGKIYVTGGALLDINYINNNGGTITVDALSSVTATSLTNSGTITMSGSSMHITGSMESSSSIQLSNSTLTVDGDISFASGISWMSLGGETITLGDNKVSMNWNSQIVVGGEWKYDFLPPVISVDLTGVENSGRKVFKLIDTVNNNMSNFLAQDESNLGEWKMDVFNGDLYLYQADQNVLSVDANCVNDADGILDNGSIVGYNAFGTVREAFTKAMTLGGGTINIIDSSSDSLTPFVKFTSAGTYTITGGNGATIPGIEDNTVAGVSVNVVNANIQLAKIRFGRNGDISTPAAEFSVTDSIVGLPGTDVSGQKGWWTFFNANLSVSGSYVGAMETLKGEGKYNFDVRSAQQVKAAGDSYKYLPYGSNYGAVHFGTAKNATIQDSTFIAGFFSASDRGTILVDNSMLYIGGGLLVNNKSNPDGVQNWTGASAADWNVGGVATVTIKDSIVRNIGWGDGGAGRGLRVGDTGYTGVLNLENSEVIFDDPAKVNDCENGWIFSGSELNINNSKFKIATLNNAGAVNVSGAEAVVSAGSIDTSGDITLTNGAELNVAGNLNLSKEGLNISGTHVAGTIITVSADSKLTAQSITFNVSNTSNGETVTYKSNMKAHVNISIDADMVSGFDQAVYKIIDVLGNDALDMSRVLVNDKSSLAGIIKTKDATFGDYMIVDMGNDVFLVKASNNNTVSVNSAWAGTALGTVMADGSVYGFNAFSNVNEAIGATKKYHNSLSFAKDTAVTVNLLSDTTYECTEAHMMLDFVNASGNDNVTVSFTGVTSEWISAQGFKIGDGVTVKMDDGSYFYVSGYSNSSNSGDKHDGHVYGTLDADYVYLLDTTVSVYDGGQMLANKGEATIQVKGPTTLNVYAGGYVETAILNVWNDAGIVGDALLNIAGGSVYAKWLHGWGGNGSQTINVTDGGELSSENLSVTQGTKLNVAGSALNVTDTLTNSSEINVSGASDISAKISGTGTVNFADGTVLTSEKGLTYEGLITPAGKLTFDDGVYSLGTLYLDGEATREFVFADGSDVTASGVLSVEGSNVATIEAGAKFNTTAGLVLGGNAPVVNVNGSVTNAANAEMPAAYDVNFDTVCFFANTATLNLTNAAVSVGGFYYNEAANYDGKPVNYTVNLNNSQLKIQTYFINTGYQITGKGEWNVVNSKLYSARNDLYFDAASTMKLTGSVADFGGITNDGTITVDYQSLFRFNAISGNGSFTIDTTGYTSGSYKVLDYTGTGSMDYSFVSGFGTDSNLKVIDNDLYVYSGDQKTIYFDDTFTADSALADGKIYGYNAVNDWTSFSGSLVVNNESWGNLLLLPEETEKLVLAGGNEKSYGMFRTIQDITIETTGSDYAVIDRFVNCMGDLTFAANSKVKVLGVGGSTGVNNHEHGSVNVYGDVLFANGSNRAPLMLWGTLKPGNFIVHKGGTFTAEAGNVQNYGGHIIVKGTMTLGPAGDAPKICGADQTFDGGHLTVDGCDGEGVLTVLHNRLNMGGGDISGNVWADAGAGCTADIKNGGKIVTSAVSFRNGVSNTLTMDGGTFTFVNDPGYASITPSYFDNKGVINVLNNSALDMTDRKFINEGTIEISNSKFIVDTFTNSGDFESNGADITVGTVTLDNSSGLTELYNTDFEVTGNSISVKEGSCFWVYEYSSLNGKNATMTVNNGAVVAVDASSTITLDAINFVGNGCLNIEIYDIYTSEGWKTIYNGGVVKVVDLDMANGIDQNKVFLLQDENQNASLFFGEDGDIYVTDAVISRDEVYVNSTYTGSGSVTSDGYIVGINAFNTVEAAIASGAAKMTITGGEFGKLSLNGTDTTITDGTINGVVYGGNADGDANVSNNSTLTIAGGKMTQTVYGGNRVHGGTSIANNGIVTVSGDIAVNVSGGSFTELIGGDIVTQAVIFVREGDINMNISGGVFSSRVHGGITVSSVVNKEHMVQTIGDINMNISGGTFNDRVYGGNWAQKYNLSDKLSHTGNISVTVNADEEIVFGEHLVIGSSGISMIHGDVKLTLSGDGSNLKFASNSILLGSSGDSYYVLDGSSKIPVSYVDGRREIVFDAFQGDVAAEIKMFDTMYLTGDSVVSFTDSAINLQEITTWNFESGSIIDSAANGIDLSGDTINLSGTWADGVAFELGSADAFTAWDNVVVNYNGVAVDCELKSENDKLIISKLA